MEITTKIVLTLAIVCIISLGVIKVIVHSEMEKSDFILTWIVVISFIGMVICLLTEIWMN